MERAIHIFDNGVQVYEDQLWPGQRARYERRNVHEAEEEDVFLRLLGRLPPGGCYVDVGAAIGYYLILARKQAPGLTIHGFEPLERHRASLRQNLELNGLTTNDFIIHSQGLTSFAGRQIFLDRGYSSRLAGDAGKSAPSLSQRWKDLLVTLRLRDSRDKTTTIETTTIDEFVRQIDCPIDLLQMDVQGLEVEVLKGATESLKTGAVKTFLIGTHGRALGLKLHEECCDQLRSNGYEIEVDLRDTKDQPDGILVASKGVG
jgi:FkbM family methyltransferase